MKIAIVEELRSAQTAVVAATARDRRNHNIDATHWHWKVYTAWLRAKRRRVPNAGQQVGACPYWRAVLFWALPRLTWHHLVLPWLAPAWRWFPLKELTVGLVMLALASGVGTSLVLWHEARMIGMWLAIVLVALALIIVTTDYWSCRLNNEMHNVILDIGKLPLVAKVPLLAVTPVSLMLIGLWRLGKWLLLRAEDGLEYVLRKKVFARFASKLLAILDAHPANRPFARPWTFMLLFAAAIPVYDKVPAQDVPLGLGLTAMVAFWIGMTMLLSKGFGRLADAIERKAQARKMALLDVIGFRKWLLNDDDFAYSHGHKLARRENPTNADIAEVIYLEDLYRFMRRFLSHGHMPIVQASAIPRRLYPPTVTSPSKGRKAWRAVAHFGAGTWALIRLIAMAAVYVKQVGACPTMTVQSTQTTNEPVTR